MNSLKVIKSKVTKSVIILKKTEDDILASWFVFDALNNARLIGTKHLSALELDNLLSQRQSLTEKGILILEEAIEKIVALLTGIAQKIEYFLKKVFSVSPNFVFKLQEEFLTIQKTRAPNY